MQREVHPANLKEFSQTLDNIENAMNRVESDRRTKSWIEKTADSLSYVGYISTALIIIIILYKCGVLELVIKCFPKKLCLFCVKTKVLNSPNIQYTLTPAAPAYSDENINIPVTSTKSIRIRPK